MNNAEQLLIVLKREVHLHLGVRGQSEERQLCFLNGEHHARLCEF